MTAIETILTTDWLTANTAKPSFLVAPAQGRFGESRYIWIKPTNKIEDYMGIASQRHYTPESHDAYEVWAGSRTSMADCTALVDEVRRICAQFSPSSPDKILQYEGGDWEYSTDYLFEFRFMLFKRKSGVELVGYT